MNFSFSSSNSFNENEISFISSKIPQKSEDWTIEENALFEKAIGDHNIEFPYIFNKIASIIPGKTIDQIKEHYKALVEDVDMIKSGHVPLPNYTDIDNNKSKSALRRERKSTQEQKTRSIRWTKEEHEKFLFGLEKYGRGDWKSISRNCVLTKTPTQVASHAQKYYIRLLKSETP